MCAIKTVLFVAVLLLAATAFCINQVNSGKKVGHHSDIRSGGPCKIGYKKLCLNGGEHYYLVDEDVVARNCTWLYGGKRCEKYMWWN